MASPQVVVGGSGISGLTAAYQLHKAGVPVQVLEARPHPGRRMLTVDWEGFTTLSFSHIQQHHGKSINSGDCNEKNQRSPSDHLWIDDLYG